ncbi:hypothetical protein [Lysobacter enzymogenes]|uniref:hypothetical protein n=1 Tax=Lysobacter enzymogenes TaxID=69 RepID=UPI00089D5E01|nr:hypothetical protein [Lysobacter enzymogenes]SDW06377.1 hypothetical protein SAMN05421681_10146 [Lysobacter enzymogenes]
MKIAQSLLALAVGLLAVGAQAAEPKVRFRVHTDAAPSTPAAAAAPAATAAVKPAAAPAAAAPALSAATVAAPAGGARAPWQGAAVPAQSVPAVYLAEWKKAKNRDRCAPLALVGAEKEAGLKVRRASFSDGWAVAYDAPDQRSAFGIAGTGLDIDGKGYRFPNNLSWSDGSKVSYGLEGGTGPGYLGYLEVAGQRCLYNIWSARGQKHLESLLLSLRKVQTP